MWKICDLSDCGMVVGSRWSGLSISEAAELMEFSQKTVCSVVGEKTGKDQPMYFPFSL